MNYSAAGELFEKIVKSEAILMKKIFKSACQRCYFYDDDDIQILFKTKNPWGGGNDLLCGVGKLGDVGGLHAMGGILRG